MIHIFKCERCNHKWASKQSHPTICPKCKSAYWDKKRKLVACSKCNDTGYIQITDAEGSVRFKPCDCK